MHMRKLFFVSFLSLVGFLCYLLQPALAKDKELLGKLVFPGAYEIVINYDEELKLTSMAYEIKQKYPSKSILEFCDSKLEELGWDKLLYPTKEGDRKWMHFIDGITEREPLVHQLGAYWNDKEKNKMILLILRYHSYTLKPKEKLYLEVPNTDILNVIVQIGPYVESTNKEKNVEIHGDNQTWSQSFQFYLSHLKPMSSTDRDSCKKLLKEILNDLDSKNNCKSDDDCRLIDEEPFGAHIPFPHNSTDAIAIKMKDYRERCHDGKTHSIRHDDLINTPVCWEERCMVKTSFREDGGR